MHYQQTLRNSDPKNSRHSPGRKVDEPPPTRRTFANEWDEIGYVYDKLLYWLYQRENADTAAAFAKRLERLLSKLAGSHDAIFGEECWSLVYETKGDLPQAIKHRANEIRLIRRLHDIARKSVNPQLVLEDYGHDVLSDRLDLLATLYFDSGSVEKALATLRESQQLCQQHGIDFDGADLLQEYSQARQQDRPSSQ
jgi:hypothetical protein